MRICLLVDPSRILRWHLWLADALSELPGCEVSLAFTQANIPLAPSVELILEIEGLLYGYHHERAMDRMDVLPGAKYRCVNASRGAKFDITVDLAGGPEEPPICRRLLVPLFNTVPGDTGAILSALDQRPLRIEVHDSREPLGSLTAEPAITDKCVLTRILDNALSCATELILKAVTTPIHPTAAKNPRQGSPKRGSMPSAARAVPAVSRMLASKSQKFLRKLLCGGHTWAVGWRFDSGKSLLNVGHSRFAVLPDDGLRYYADPFPYFHKGESFVFAEEYQFALRRGCISVARIDSEGRASRPRQVIEESHHLSFPFIFDWGGEIWMIPESGAAGQVNLYRAKEFPYRWQREGVLLDGIAAYDATLLIRNNQLWLFTTVARWQASTSDNLYAFHAERLDGPWRPHPMNPLLLGATQCRPAGAFLQRDLQTYRFAQDCSKIYGGAISICRLDALDYSTFGQTVVGRIESSVGGCHTYNRHSGLEVLDVFGAVRGLKQVTASCGSIQGHSKINLIAGDEYLPGVAPQSD